MPENNSMQIKKHIARHARERMEMHKGFGADARGTATLETALMLPVLLFLLLGIFAFTFVSYTKTAVSEAAREAASHAAVRHGLPGANPVAEGKSAARHILTVSVLNPAQASVSVTVSGGFAHAEVSYPIPEFVTDLGRLLGGGPLGMGSVRSSASVPLEKN